MINEIKEFSVEFFEKMWIEIDNLDVILEWEDIFFVKINTPDFPILIWRHWFVFESVQSILRNIFSNKYDKKIRIHLEINDYIHNKDAKLFSMVDSKIEFVKKIWKNIMLPPLNAYERKKVHSYVIKLWDKSIKSKSSWEWKDRRMSIIYKNDNLDKNYFKASEISHKKLDIDIDGDDI